MLTCALVAGTIFLTDGRSAVSADAIASMEFERGFVQHSFTIQTTGGSTVQFNLPTDHGSRNPVAVLQACIERATMIGSDDAKILTDS